MCSVMDEEFHLLLECKKFVDNRKKLIRSNYMYKCDDMFPTRNKKVVRNLAKYDNLPFNAAR